MIINPIAIFHSPLTSKFGIPKQSGLVENIFGSIVFEPQYRNADYIRGMEGYDYLWLVWEFSANKHKANSPVVRPPVLGGNEKMGVFATRSPFRPNPLGLSSVKIENIDYSSTVGPTIIVSGGDLMDGTPIYDIKPYLPFTDAHPNAKGGFSAERGLHLLKVNVSDLLKKYFHDEQLDSLCAVLAHDPRPQYIEDSPDRIYGMPFAGFDIHFRVVNDTVDIIDIVKLTTLNS